MKWSAEQIEAMEQILKLQAQFKLSDLDLYAYDWIQYVKDDEDIQEFDKSEASDLASEVYCETAQENSRDYKMIVFDNWK